MNGIATLAGASTDQVIGPIAIVIAATIAVNLQLHWIFDVVPTVRASGSTRVQRRNASTTVIRLATNQAPLTYSAIRFAHTDGSPNVPAASTAKTTMRGCC
jgi:hypothetical protein